MSKIDDPDNIGWNYHIYRSNESGTFIANVGGFHLDHTPKRFAFFRHFKGKGFFVEDGEHKLYLSLDSVRAMMFIMEKHYEQH